nr:S1-like domain-containing RNA-binding protein [Echinimonas agarilytica]
MGQMNRLSVTERQDEAWLLHAEGDDRQVMLPIEDAPNNMKIDDSIQVFVYRDTNENLVATTARPQVMVGQMAMLTAKHNTAYGTFFDWGLPKDILVPRREQREPVEPGEKMLVYVYIDDADRIAASGKYRNYIDLERHSYQDGDEVHITVGEETPLGFGVVIDYKFSGLIYEDELFRKVKIGDQFKGYIRQVREDGLLDVSTQQPGYGKVPVLAEQILKKLEKTGGKLMMSDKSDPRDIKREFNCSKKAFKQAIGALKKNQTIDIFPDSIVLKK